MRPVFLSNTFSVIVLCLAIGGCASTAHETAVVGEVPWQAYWHYANGDLLELQGHLQEALVEYIRALEYDSQSVTLRLAAARVLGQLGGWQEAADILEQTARLDPGSPDVLLHLGDCYTHLRQMGEAEKTYRRVLQLDRDNILAHQRMAAIYEWQGEPQKANDHYQRLLSLVSHPEEIYLRRADNFLRLKKYKQAIDDYRRALDIDEHLVEAYHGLAQTFEFMGQPQQAVAVYETAIEGLPERPVLRLHLAELLIRLDRPQEAIEQYHRLAADDRASPPVLKRLAILLFHAGQYGAARDILLRLASMTPDDAGLQLYLGRTAAGEGDLDAAVEYFHRAVALDDSLAEAWIGLGIAFLQKGDDGSAEDVLERGVLRLGDDARLIHLLGVCHIRRERYLLAVGDLERALSLDPQNIGIMRDLANSYERAGYFQKAVSLFQVILTQQPDDHWALNYLGYMLADAGYHLHQARDLIKRALTLDPDNVYYLDSMGWVYYRLGDVDLAEEYLLRATARSPDQAIIYKHLGDIYHRQGREDEAREQWQRALQLEPDEERMRHKLEPGDAGRTEDVP